VQREVRTQLSAMGVATKDDLDALKKRVRDLERGGAPKRSTAKKRTTTRKAAAKKPAADAPAVEAPAPADASPDATV